MARIQPITKLKMICLAIQVTMLSGCLMGDNYKKPDIKMPVSYSYSEQKEIEQFTANNWWNNFNDKTLDEIVEISIKNNWDVLIATERIFQSLAVVDKEGAALLPQVGVGSYIARKQTGQNNVPTSKGIYDELGVSAGVLWEADLFGRIRRKKESAIALSESSKADRDNLLLIVISQVIQEYSALRMTQEQIQITNKNIELSNQIVKYNEDLFKQGLVNSITLYDIKKQNSLLKAQLPKLKATEDSFIYSLSILSGGFPNELEEKLRQPSEPLNIIDQKIPKSLPSDLLRERPDIRSVEQQMISSNALVGSAIADFMPKFIIPLGTGYNTSPFDLLFNPSSFIWSIGTNIAQPIYTGGRLSANLEIAKSVNKEDQLKYEQIVRIAVKEVEDSLSNYYQATNEERDLQIAITNQKQIVNDSNKLLKQGLQSTPKNLTYTQNLHDLEVKMLTVKNERVYFLTTLYKSIGGKWTEKEKTQP